MGVHVVDGLTWNMTFIREKYGLARWDYTVTKDGEEVGSGCDRNTIAFDEMEAIKEMMAEDEKLEAEMLEGHQMEKLSFTQLESNDSWKKAVIVFKPESFGKEFSEIERSYAISKDNKYFNPMMGGNSLFGNCLDGKDDGVRLDTYMRMSPEEGRRWIVEYCYVTE